MLVLAIRPVIARVTVIPVFTVPYFYHFLYIPGLTAASAGSSALSRWIGDFQLVWIHLRFFVVKSHGVVILLPPVKGFLDFCPY